MDFIKMPADARVWVYQADRPFSPAEQEELSLFFQQFTAQWTAHNKQLSASMDLLYDRFVVVMVDESRNEVSGCGIDKSVHFLKTIEADFNVSFFNRLLVAYKKGDEVKAVKSSEIPGLIAAAELNEDSLVFNPMVQTRAEFDSNWLIPLKKSWLARHLPGVHA